MSNLTREEEERYSDMAMKHAHFLCDRIFKPAFEMAFIHGAKHMKEDMSKPIDREQERAKRSAAAQIASINKGLI